MIQTSRSFPPVDTAPLHIFRTPVKKTTKNIRLFCAYGLKNNTSDWKVTGKSQLSSKKLQFCTKTHLCKEAYSSVQSNRSRKKTADLHVQFELHLRENQEQGHERFCKRRVFTFDDGITWFIFDSFDQASVWGSTKHLPKNSSFLRIEKVSLYHWRGRKRY